MENTCQGRMGLEMRPEIKPGCRAQPELGCPTDWLTEYLSDEAAKTGRAGWVVSVNCKYKYAHTEYT